MDATEQILSPNVSVIPATRRNTQTAGGWKKKTNLRVAAYCRVSTGDESQQTSYTNQKAYYTGLIQNRDGWQFAGIYADEAISGTSRAHRREFNRMIDDAKKDRMDYIITKSISRFARNTVDTLNCVRELRMQSPPVGIFFEKENIDTLDAAGELILTILSALAQDESRSISENIRWTFQKKFQAGIPQINLNRMLGYDKAPDGAWVINPGQAEIVRHIFDRYAAGYSANKIAAELNQLHYQTVNGKNWTSGAVLTVLRNEKYVGDLEMQKTITKDFLTHRSVPNRGEAPRYYVENHHIGIIDRLTWDKVQAILCGQLTGPQPDDHFEKKKKGPRRSPLSILQCGGRTNRTKSDQPIQNDSAEQPSAGRQEEGEERFLRLTYTGTLSDYRDERCLALTEGDASRYLEKYTYAYPVWRCKRKAGGKNKGGGKNKAGENNEVGGKNKAGENNEVGGKNRDGENNKAAKIRRTTDLSSESSACDACINATLYECAVEQSFMEMLYTLKRDYESKGDDSRICIMFQEAYDRMYEQLKISNPSLLQAEILEQKITEMAADLAQVEVRQKTALETMEKYASENSENNRTPDTEHKIYQELARDLRQHLNELIREKETLELEAGPAADMQNNFRFFLQCLQNLPDQNEAGQKLLVYGLDTAKDRNESAEDADNCPDYLPFEQGIYTAFIVKGVVQGDTIEYTSNFGVKLLTTGNRRTLNSFLGFRRAKEDGTSEPLDAPHKICSSRIQYRRYLRKGAQKEEDTI